METTQFVLLILTAISATAEKHTEKRDSLQHNYDKRIESKPYFPEAQRRMEFRIVKHSNPSNGFADNRHKVVVPYKIIKQGGTKHIFVTMPGLFRDIFKKAPKIRDSKPISSTNEHPFDSSEDDSPGKYINAPQESDFQEIGSSTFDFDKGTANFGRTNVKLNQDPQVFSHAGFHQEFFNSEAAKLTGSPNVKPEFGQGGSVFNLGDSKAQDYAKFNHDALALYKESTKAFPQISPVSSYKQEPSIHGHKTTISDHGGLGQYRGSNSNFYEQGSKYSPQVASLSTHKEPSGYQQETTNFIPSEYTGGSYFHEDGSKFSPHASSYKQEPVSFGQGISGLSQGHSEQSLIPGGYTGSSSVLHEEGSNFSPQASPLTSFKQEPSSYGHESSGLGQSSSGQGLSLVSGDYRLGKSAFRPSIPEYTPQFNTAYKTIDNEDTSSKNINNFENFYQPDDKFVPFTPVGYSHSQLSQVTGEKYQISDEYNNMFSKLSQEYGLESNMTAEDENPAPQYDQSHDYQQRAEYYGQAQESAHSPEYSSPEKYSAEITNVNNQQLSKSDLSPVTKYDPKLAKMVRKVLYEGQGTPVADGFKIIRSSEDNSMYLVGQPGMPLDAVPNLSSFAFLNNSKRTAKRSTKKFMDNEFA